MKRSLWRAFFYCKNRYYGDLASQFIILLTKEYSYDTVVVVLGFIDCRYESYNMAKNQENNELTPDIGCLPIIALLALTAAALVACTPKSVEIPVPVANKSVAPGVIQNGGRNR